MLEDAGTSIDLSEQIPAEVIGAELDAHKQLLWAGRPSHALMFRARDFFWIPYSLVILAIAVFMEARALQVGRVPALIPLPLILFALYLCAGQFFVDMRQRKCTIYGLTSERIIILSGVFRRTAKSLHLGTLKP